MIPRDPYRSNPTREFVIAYEGLADGFHAYRVKLRGRDGFQGHLFKNQICDFLLNEATGRHHFGNHFGTQRGEPEVSFPNKDLKDFFVLFASRLDMALFERTFTVTGLSPIHAK